MARSRRDLRSRQAFFILQRPRTHAENSGVRRRIPALAALALVITFAPGCATLGLGPDFHDSRLERSDADRGAEVGYASFYSSEFHGRRTASGRRYDEGELTAAHRTLPFGTRVRVTNLGNDRSVLVTITDRGPFRSRRIIDVSKRAAREMGFVHAGTARVRVEVVSG